ncbi:MAG: hypothetical protein M1840_007046 [Geoglossum simile]|nr:MAG: hypothetical protein M1840_007046 [Geoglossum simile]
MDRWTNPPSASLPPSRRGAVPGGRSDYYEMGAFEEPPWETTGTQYQPKHRQQRPLRSFSKTYSLVSQSPMTPSFPSSQTSPEIIYNAPSGSTTPLISAVPPRKSVGSVGSEASISSVVSSRTRLRSDPMTENLVRLRSRTTAIWKIHWYMPTAMVFLLLLGVLGAVSHHLFYLSLHGKPATDQLLKVRFGTAFAFFTRSMLVGSSVVAYRQRIWHTLREKAMTLNGIDSLFSVIEDPTMFGNWEMVRNAKLATLMAFTCWVIPIASVLSPAALTASVEVTTNSTICPAVPTLDFSQEGLYNFRETVEFPGFSLAYYNTTSGAAAPGYFDYYDQPSKINRRLATLAVYNKQPVSDDVMSLNACSAGWNCTYYIKFTGPGYKCEEIANNKDSADSVIYPPGSPFNTSILAPIGDMIYYADVDIGDYLDPQVPEDYNATIDHHPPDLGTFKAEPVLWVGYTINTTKPISPTSVFAKKWKFELVSHIFKCQHYEVNYTIHMNYSEGHQYATITERNWLAPIVDTTPTLLPDGVNFTIPNDEINREITPDADPERYKRIAAYHSLGALLRNFLRGTIQQKEEYPLTKTDLSETKLTDPSTAYAVGDLMNKTQSMYEDMLLTLLSEPHLTIASNASVPCVKTRHVNLYYYYAQSLWIGYALVVAAATACVVAGAYAIRENGVSSDTMFSRILVTTRNPTLDRLAHGACLGGDPFPKVLKQVKLRFGVLDEEGTTGTVREDDDRPSVLYGMQVEHCAFGIESETKAIVKGGLYAGLRGHGEDCDGEYIEGDERERLVGGEGQRRRRWRRRFSI